MNEYLKSLKYQHLSLSKNEKIIAADPGEEELANAKEGRSYALHNICSIYQELKLYDQAFAHEFISIVNEIEVGNSVGVGISYNTLASLHKSLNNTDSAIYYFEKALDIFRQFESPNGLASALQSYASLKNSGLSDERRKEMILESLDLSRKLGDVDSEAQTLINIGESEFDRLSNDSLSSLVEKIYLFIKENDLGILNAKYYRLYSKYSSRIGRYDSAYFALENFLELKEISEEKNRIQDLIAEDVRKHLLREYFEDSLQIENSFALERAEYNEEITSIQNKVYLSVFGLIILITFLAFFINSNRRRKRMNSILSEKNALIASQKAMVDRKNTSISDSINYAKRLQTAILPTANQVDKFLPDSFVLFKPKDIVSGDFLWFESNNDTILIAVADCTGHGVPGAMVSVVCSNALNRVVNEFGLKEPDKILNKTRELVIRTFGKGGSDVVDGMDIALCAIDLEKKKMVFSGANNPVWIVRKNKSSTAHNADTLLKGALVSLLEYKGDKQPVGYHSIQKEFSSKEIELIEGDSIYLFTDGYADQFGGKLGKKLKYKPFKQKLMEINSMTMQEQRAHLDDFFETWKSGIEQIDDVCVMGFRLS
jgi:serine phosphatase RsbU (regulator of sigma subunit)/tetratricopeptide (TPR) repeat protein